MGYAYCSFPLLEKKMANQFLLDKGIIGMTMPFELDINGYIRKSYLYK